MSTSTVYIPGSGGKSGQFVNVPNKGGMTYVPARR